MHCQRQNKGQMNGSPSNQSPFQGTKSAYPNLRQHLSMSMWQVNVWIGQEKSFQAKVEGREWKACGYTTQGSRRFASGPAHNQRPAPPTSSSPGSIKAGPLGTGSPWRFHLLAAGCISQRPLCSLLISLHGHSPGHPQSPGE